MNPSFDKELFYLGEMDLLHADSSCVGVEIRVPADPYRIDRIATALGRGIYAQGDKRRRDVSDTRFQGYACENDTFPKVTLVGLEPNLREFDRIVYEELKLSICKDLEQKGCLSLIKSDFTCPTKKFGDLVVPQEIWNRREVPIISAEFRLPLLEVEEFSKAFLKSLSSTLDQRLEKDLGFTGRTQVTGYAIQTMGVQTSKIYCYLENPILKDLGLDEFVKSRLDREAIRSNELEAACAPLPLESMLPNSNFGLELKQVPSGVTQPLLFSPSRMNKGAALNATSEVATSVPSATSSAQHWALGVSLCFNVMLLLVVLLLAVSVWKLVKSHLRANKAAAETPRPKAEVMLDVEKTLAHHEPSPSNV